MKTMPGVRVVNCRKCGGKGGWTKIIGFGLHVFVTCRECLGRGRSRQFVGKRGPSK